LPSPGEGAPTAGDGPDDGGRALLPLPSLWHPTFGGDEPLVGCECDVAAGLRLLGAAVADGLRAGAIATRGPWRVGALVQGADREWMPDLWLSRRSAGEEIQVEAVRQTDGRWWAGTRVIGAHGLGARGRIFWWDLQARVPVPGRGPDMSIRGERAASPEARRQGSLGWRGRRGSCAATWTEVQSSGADPRLRQTVSRKASGQGRLSLPGGGSAAVRCDWTARTRRREDRDGLPWTIESAQSERRGRVRATWWRPSSSAGRGLPGCRLAQWGGELGLEVSASGAERKATAPGRWSGVWWGVGATRYSARFGVLQVTAPSGGIDLTPSWAEGTGGRLRGGLWAAARVDGRAGPLRLVARALLPTPARDGAARPWVLSMLVQMDAAGRPAATPGAED